MCEYSSGRKLLNLQSSTRVTRLGTTLLETLVALVAWQRCCHRNSVNLSARLSHTRTRSKPFKRRICGFLLYGIWIIQVSCGQNSWSWVQRFTLNEGIKMGVLLLKVGLWPTQGHHSEAVRDRTSVLLVAANRTSIQTGISLAWKSMTVNSDYVQICILRSANFVFRRASCVWISGYKFLLSADDVKNNRFDFGGLIRVQEIFKGFCIYQSINLYLYQVVKPI